MTRRRLWIAVAAEGVEDAATLRARLPGRSQIMPVLDDQGRAVDFAAPFHLPQGGGRP